MPISVVIVLLLLMLIIVLGAALSMLSPDNLVNAIYEYHQEFNMGHNPPTDSQTIIKE